MYIAQQVFNPTVAYKHSLLKSKVLFATNPDVTKNTTYLLEEWDMVNISENEDKTIHLRLSAKHLKTGTFVIAVPFSKEVYDDCAIVLRTVFIDTKNENGCCTNGMCMFFPDDSEQDCLAFANFYLKANDVDNERDYMLYVLHTNNGIIQVGNKIFVD